LSLHHGIVSNSNSYIWCVVHEVVAGLIGPFGYGRLADAIGVSGVGGVEAAADVVVGLREESKVDGSSDGGRIAWGALEFDLESRFSSPRGGVAIRERPSGR
jgi:hypothetical protein